MDEDVGTGVDSEKTTMELDVATVAMVMGIGMGFKLVEQIEPRRILEHILRGRAEHPDNDPNQRPPRRLLDPFRANDGDEITEPRQRVAGSEDSKH